MLFELYLSFVKIGFTSFGGLSMLSLITEEMLAHNWMSVQEISDIAAIAEMTPGPLGLNCATFAGMKVAGIFGVFAAILGALTPTLTVGILAAIFFERFRDSKLIKNLLDSIRPVCIGMVFSIVFTLGFSNYFGNGSVQIYHLIIGIISLLLLTKYKISIPIVICISALLGLFTCIV